MPNQNKVVVGFDVGSHKIGVAVGQTLTRQAKPLTRLSAKQGLPNAGELKKLLEEWRPHALVVGVPTQMDGTPQFTTELALAFITFLKTLSKTPVFPIDERLTTKAARSEIFAQGGYKKLKKADVDGYAAKLMVESWMNEQEKNL